MTAKAFSRRRFIQTSSATGLAMMSLPECWSQSSGPYVMSPTEYISPFTKWNPLQRMKPVAPDNLVLRAAITEIDIGTGVK